MKILTQDYFARNPKVTQREFAKDMGFVSHNFLNLVIQGKKNLSPESTKKICDFFKFNMDESHFFKNLVLFNQAETQDEKRAFAEQLIKSKGFKKAFPLAEFQREFFTHWHYVAIRELVATTNFKEDYDWISKKLGRLISPSEAKQAVDGLLALRMIERTPTNTLKPAQGLVLTPDEVTQSFAASYHTQMIDLARDSIKNHPRENRMINGYTFRMNQKHVPYVRELALRYSKELIAILQEHQEDADGVYQFNIQFFPLVSDDPEGEN